MTNIKLNYMSFVDNIEDESSSDVSSGHSLIIVTEDGAGCNQLEYYYESDGFENAIETMSQFTMTNAEFIKNEYTDSLIDSYCSAGYLDNVQFINNYGNLTSGIHTDSSYMLITNNIII